MREVLSIPVPEAIRIIRQVKYLDGRINVTGHDLNEFRVYKNDAIEMLRTIDADAPGILVGLVVDYEEGRPYAAILDSPDIY